MNQFIPKNITEFIKSTAVLLLSRQKGCDFLEYVIRDLEWFKINAWYYDKNMYTIKNVNKDYWSMFYKKILGFQDFLKIS